MKTIVNHLKNKDVLDSILYPFKSFFYWIIYHFAMRTFLSVILGVQFDINDSIEKEEQFILVANHNSHVDSMALLCSIPSKSLINTCTIAAGDYFGKNKISAFFMKMILNAKLIDRNGGGRSVINSLDKLLKRGKSIIIFPEGSRGEPGVLQDFKLGVAILLKNNPHIPYIPVYLEDLHKVLPKGDPFIIPHTSKIIMGEVRRITPDMETEEILVKIKENIMELKQKKN